VSDIKFKYSVSPTDDEINEVHQITPYTPFHYPPYVKLFSSLGEKPCTLALYDGSDIITGCIGFVTKGFMSGTLEIKTVPEIPYPDIFWDGVLKVCKKLKVWELIVGSSHSIKSEIPHLLGEIERHKRYEYVLDLNSEKLFKSISHGHYERIKKAKKKGLSVMRSTDKISIMNHLNLMKKSMIRRKERGENVIIPNSINFQNLLLESKLGELFQVSKNDSVLSSVLVVKINKHAYTQTSGNSPKGMKIGTSHFLRFELANLLKKEGFIIFNIGGASDDNVGLQKFKEGFGARRIELESASFSMVNPLKRIIRNLTKQMYYRLTIPK